jgi:hypothetical protein
MSGIALRTKKNRDAILFASLFCRTISRDLVAGYGIVREVQVIGAGAVQVDPTLNYFA